MIKDISKILIFITVTAFLFLIPNLVSAKSDDLTSDELWKKAFHIVNSNNEWIPREIHYKYEERSRGQVKYTYDAWIKNIFINQNTSKEELTKFTEKGKKISTCKDDYNYRWYNNDDFSPFYHGIETKNYLSVKSKRIENIGKKQFCIYNYIKKVQDSDDFATFSGRAFIDKKTGAPLKFEYKYKWESGNSGEEVVKYQFNQNDNSLFIVERISKTHNRISLLVSFDIVQFWRLGSWRKILNK